MRKRILKLGLLLLIMLGFAFQASAQSTFVRVIVTLNDGTEISHDMLGSSHMYFEDNVKLVFEEGIDGLNVIKYPLADIRKLTCHELEGSEEYPSLDVDLYPNPVHNVLTLRNITGKHLVSIYALDGRLMKSFEVTGNQSYDVSDLPVGLYLVNIGYNTYKMMKL